MVSWKDFVDPQAVLECATSSAYLEDEEERRKRGRKPRVFDAAAGRMRSLEGCDKGVCTNPDCGAKRAVTRLEWTRAARPTCLKCGALVVRSAAAERRERKKQLAANVRAARLGHHV